jgi:hypothetical protein
MSLQRIRCCFAARRLSAGLNRGVFARVTDGGGTCGDLLQDFLCRPLREFEGIEVESVLPAVCTLTVAAVRYTTYCLQKTRGRLTARFKHCQLCRLSRLKGFSGRCGAVFRMLLRPMGGCKDCSSLSARSSGAVGRFASSGLEDTTEAEPPFAMVVVSGGAADVDGAKRGAGDDGEAAVPGL